MAWSNSGSTYTSNSVPGWLDGIGQSSIYDVDATAKFAIGSGFKRADGNIYRYGNFISAVTQGKLVSPTTGDVQVTYSQPPIVLGTTATQQNGDLVGIYPSLIGSRYILTTASAAVLNQWAGGYVTISNGTGEGYCYRIKGNSASATLNAVTNQVLIELYEPLVLSLDTSVYISIIGCMYGDLIGNLISSNYAPVGVTQANMTANSYGWICTHGVTQILTAGSITPPATVSASATAGAVITSSTTTSTLVASPTVGYCIDGGASGHFATVYLTIE